MLKLGFIGTGNMATAWIKSMASEDTQIITSDKSEEKLLKAKKEFHLKTTKDNKEVARNSEIIFLCSADFFLKTCFLAESWSAGIVFCPVTVKNKSSMAVRTLGRGTAFPVHQRLKETKDTPSFSASLTWVRPRDFLIISNF